MHGRRRVAVARYRMICLVHAIGCLCLRVMQAKSRKYKGVFKVKSQKGTASYEKRVSKILWGSNMLLFTSVYGNKIKKKSTILKYDAKNSNLL